MAQVGHRPGEFLPPVIAFLVAPAHIYYVFVFLKVFLLFSKEGRIYLEFREHVVAVNLVAFDFVVHLHSPLDDFRMVGEKRAHFLLAFEVFLLGVSHPVRRVEERVAVEADEPVVCGAVLFSYEVYIIGGQYFCPCLPCQFEYAFVDGLLPFIEIKRLPWHFCPVKLDFKIVVIPEHLLVPFYGLFGPIHVSGVYQAWNLSCDARRAADEVRGILLNDLVRHSRTVVHTFYMPGGHDFHQVLVSVVVLGEQNQMVVALVLGILEPVVVMRGHIYLASYDRLYPRMFLGKFIELLDTVHVPMVSDGDSRHSEFLRPVKKGLDGRKTISDGILGMYMKMNERHDRLL